jgi:ParB-like chromosome segregation protein Spo0J
MTGRTLKVERLAIEAIDVPEGRRTLNDVVVDAIAESMKVVGLRQPITVRHFSNRSQYELVTGAHRHGAAIRLKWTEIDCFVAAEDDVDAELWEFDENLCRAELSEAEETELLLKRKEVYERIHPETKKGGDRRSAKAKSKSQDATSVDPPVAAFIDATAKQTGKNRATVARKVQRGKRIGANNVTKIKRTSLDKPAEMKALANLPPEERDPLVAKAAAGEKVTARAKSGKKPGKKASDDKVYGPDRELWNEMRKALRLLASGSLPSDEMARIALRCGEDNESIQALLDETMQNLTEFRTAWFGQTGEDVQLIRA